MRQKLTIYAGLLAIGLAGSGSAMAQVLPFYPAPPVVPPQEVVKIVRASGMEPLSRPVRHGPAYVLQAANPAGREVRVVVDGRSGRIVRIVPMGPAPVAAAPDVPALPPPYSRPPAEVAAVPDGYGPTGRATGLPPNFDGPAPYGPTVGDAPPLPATSSSPGRTPGTTANASPPRASAPPLPRPRPKLAAAEPATSGPAPASSSATPASAAPAANSASTRGTTGTVPAVTAPTATPEYEQHE